jgi:hypothetical protein
MVQAIQKTVSFFMRRLLKVGLDGNAAWISLLAPGPAAAEHVDKLAYRAYSSLSLAEEI